MNIRCLLWENISNKIPGFFTVTLTYGKSYLGTTEEEGDSTLSRLTTASKNQLFQEEERIHATAHIWRSEDSSVEWIPSFHFTQVLRTELGLQPFPHREISLVRRYHLNRLRQRNRFQLNFLHWSASHSKPTFKGRSFLTMGPHTQQTPLWKKARPRENKKHCILNGTCFSIL